MNKAVVLLSGGLDSATTLYQALKKGYQCYCLIFDYGQRHKKEILQAQRIARKARCQSVVVCFHLPWKGSALLDKTLRLPRGRALNALDIPATYVPARNIIFLSLAASYAETVGACTIFIGANAVDYSGYPDCRPDFIKAYQQMLARGLKTSVEGKPVKIMAPLMRLNKAQIVRLAVRLQVPIHWTWSCYKGANRPCGACDSCRLRAQGFLQAKVVDEG